MDAISYFGELRLRPNRRRSLAERGMQFAASIGVFGGLGFNFMANRFAVFRMKHIRIREAAVTVTQTRSQQRSS